MFTCGVLKLNITTCSLEKTTKYYFRLYIHEESGREGLGENWLQAVQQKCKIIQEQRSVDIDEPAVMVSLMPPSVEIFSNNFHV